MKRSSTALILVAGLLCASEACASPFDSPASQGGAAAEFQAVALSDAELSEETAMALPVRQRYRTIADQYSEGLLQQISQDSRIALDNWWAQTGASLVANSVLSR